MFSVKPCNVDLRFVGVKRQYVGPKVVIVETLNIKTVV